MGYQAKKLLTETLITKKRLIEEGFDFPPVSDLTKFLDGYDEILALADTECPPPPEKDKKPKKGRQKKGTERALIERLVKLKDQVCLFFKDFKVPFDNNQAERDIRCVKIKVKVSGCFRTEEGARDYLIIMSYCPPQESLDTVLLML